MNSRQKGIREHSGEAVSVDRILALLPAKKTATAWSTSEQAAGIIVKEMIQFLS